MKKRDEEIIKFILTADNETLTNWFNTSSNEDVEYAANLLCVHLQNLQERLSVYLDRVDNIDQAADFLRKFRL